MEVAGGHDQKWLVFRYEFFGTAVLTYAVLVSGGNMFAVPLTLFLLIITAERISGAHFNPAVTTGVYIMNKNWRKDRDYYFLILFAEFLGSLLGIVISYIILMPSYIQGTVEIIPSGWLTPLCPVGVNPDGDLVNNPCDDENYRDRSAFMFQFFSTFLFVSIILLVKNG